MTVKDTLLIVLWVIIFGVSTAVSYKVYVLDRDYAFVTLIPCDPEAEICFVASCDPESETYLEDICLMVEEGATERYFSYIKKKMKNVEQCDSRDEECAPLVCEENEEGCEVISCDKETLEEYADEGTECTEAVMPEEEVLEEESTEVVPEEPDQTTTPIETGGEILTPAPDTTEEVIPETAPETAVPATEEPAVEPEPTHNLPI